MEAGRQPQGLSSNEAYRRLERLGPPEDTSSRSVAAAATLLAAASKRD